MNIGEAAAASGLTPKMIRYSERNGLVPAPARAGNTFRVYAPFQIARLTFIRRARALGFPLAQTGRLIALWQDRDRASAEVKAIARAHAADLTARIAELEAMRATLEHLAQACHGNGRPVCPIPESMAPSAAFHQPAARSPCR